MTEAWRVREPAPEEWLETLHREVGLSPAALRVCYARGFRDAASIKSLLDSDLARLPRPESILGIQEAVGLLAAARGQKLRVYGDYDVDGTCGAALLTRVLSALGFTCDSQQPDRFADGYGLHTRYVEAAHADGVSVLITVDCGITSFDALERARELGLKTVVVDHHQISKERGLPPANVIIDPHQAGCASGLVELCGTGLAFFLSLALRARAREARWCTEAPNLRRELDLVSVATACDQVPLGSVNRTLVRHGLKVLREGQRVGLRALLESAKVSRGDCSLGSLGFVLGPRINASGRLASASLALRLLTTTSEREAYQLAGELDALNKERSLLQEAVTQAALAQVAQVAGAYSVVVADASWHEGVLGIVASRVVESTHKSAAVLGVHDGVVKGSLRAARGQSVLAALEACRDLLVSFGGHRAAAGVKLKVEDLEAFRLRFDEALSSQPQQELGLELDAWLKLADLDMNALEDLERLGPYGNGHPEPLVGLRVAAEVTGTVRDQHLRVALREESLEAQGIWFRAAGRTWNAGKPVQCAVTPEIQRYRGRARPGFRVRGLRQ